MEKMFISPEACKACKFCEANCPKTAIKIEGPINKAGYPTPVVDKEKCILCGICFNMCPDYVYEIKEEEAK